MSGVGRSEGPTQPDGGGVGAGKSVGRVTRVGVRGVGRDREGRSVGRCFDLPRRIFVFSSEVRLTAEAQLRACKHTYTWRNNSNERHTRTVRFKWHGSSSELTHLRKVFLYVPSPMSAGSI